MVTVSIFTKVTKGWTRDAQTSHSWGLTTPYPCLIMRKTRVKIRGPPKHIEEHKIQSQTWIFVFPCCFPQFLSTVTASATDQNASERPALSFISQKIKTILACLTWILTTQEARFEPDTERSVGHMFCHYQQSGDQLTLLWWQSKRE